MKRRKHANRKSARRARHKQETPSDFLTRLAFNAESRVLPIDDPCGEKKLLELHGAEKWLEYLRKKARASALCVSPKETRRRICEVYRLLYKQSELTKKKHDVISDFAAHFPQLVLDRSWLAEFFILRETGDPHPDRPLVYEAVSAGLQRAANSTPQERHVRKLEQLAAARSFQQNIQRKFRDFVDELFAEGSPKLAAPGWAEEMVSEKMQDLTTRFPRLSPVSDKIARLLLKGHAYKASIIAAHAVCDVRERDLEGKLW